MKKSLIGLGALPAFLMSSLSAFSATPIELNHQPASILKTFLATQKTKSLQTTGIDLKEIHRASDFRRTQHIRIQEMYAGYPVLGGDAIVHIPNAGESNKTLLNSITENTTLTGKLYQNLQADLANTPAYVFNAAQSQKALQQAIKLYQAKVGATPAIKNEKCQLVVYVDNKNKAHWAFQVNFDAEPVKANSLPEKPVFILDAISLEIYEEWNDLKTLDNVDGGGFGGNQKMGKVTYDGTTRNEDKLSIQRDPVTKTCYLKNADVTVKKCTESTAQGQCNAMQNFTFACASTDPLHNNLYWNGDADAVNGAYSPSDDALWGGGIVKALYQQWYGLPVLVEDGKPMMLNMVVHVNMENAYWDGQEMVFGDGGSTFYPLTSLDVTAHEVSHGFTEQWAGLIYRAQSGGMNESFSDMAAQAAQFYTKGTNNWQIGPEIMKEDGALRYMDKPSKDCEGREPGDNCSIDNATQYKFGLDVHYSSGVYNRLFYLIATSSGWDTRKAFNIMVQANMYYWTKRSNYEDAACGVLKATTDYGYDQATVKTALTTVGIKANNC